jgi:MSHA pilin protein MshD
MNTGQSLFSIGALLILSLTILKMNNFILANDTVMMDSKLGILAVSLATSLIEEASKKAFDANTVSNEVTACSLLTNYPLGRGVGEIEDSSITFNDFDDYEGYEYHYSNLPSAEYQLNCTVYYVNPTEPETKVSYRTWHKKMDVIVTSESMKDTIRMSTIYSYWHFR